jgi:hypothetical protein
MDLAYTTIGGVIGAALTNYFARHQERRQLRAAVMHELHRVAAVRDEVRDIVPSRRKRPAQRFAGKRLLVTDRFNLTVVLDDDSDAENAQREAVSALVVASLSAGIPRRVLDFAGGGEERALQCEVIRLIDLRVGGVLGETLEELMTRCEDYRRSTAQLLLQALWHPWQVRLRMHARVRALRRDVDALRHRQQAAMSILAQPEIADALVERLGPHPDRDAHQVDNAPATKPSGP